MEINITNIRTHVDTSILPNNSITHFEYGNYTDDNYVAFFLCKSNDGVLSGENSPADAVRDDDAQYITPDNIGYNSPSKDVINKYNESTNKWEYVVNDVYAYYRIFKLLSFNHKHTFIIKLINTDISGFVTLDDIPSNIVTNSYHSFKTFTELSFYLNEIKNNAQLDYIRLTHKLYTLRSQ